MFLSPSTILVVGSSFSGKSTWLRDCIINSKKIFQQEVGEITYCYSLWQKPFEELKQYVTFHQGVKQNLELKPFHQLYIFDDLFPGNDPSQLEFFRLLFCQLAHHLNITAIVISHNLYYKELRSCSLNAHYFVLFRALRDVLQIKTFAQQLCGDKWKFLMRAYDLATHNKPFSYIICSVRQETHGDLRYFSDIFNDKITYFISDSINTPHEINDCNYAAFAGEAGFKKSTTR